MLPHRPSATHCNEMLMWHYHFLTDGAQIGRLCYTYNVLSQKLYLYTLQKI
jgi:hypothetical protein